MGTETTLLELQKNLTDKLETIKEMPQKFIYLARDKNKGWSMKILTQYPQEDFSTYINKNPMLRPNYSCPSEEALTLVSIMIGGTTPNTTKWLIIPNREYYCVLIKT